MFFLFNDPDLSGQDFNNPIITDRPDITESALTVPLSSLQIETGFILHNNSETIDNLNANIKSYSILGTLLRYGLFSGIELRVGTEYLYQKINLDGLVGGNDKLEGINELFIGSKIQIFRDNPSLPDASVFFHFRLPLGSKHFRSEHVEPEILISTSHSIIDPFSLSYNLGGNWESGEEKVNYFYSTSISAALSGRTGAFLEIFGEASSGSTISFNLDGGLTYLLEENFQADISAGFDFDTPEDNWFISTGASLRLPE